MTAPGGGLSRENALRVWVRATCAGWLLGVPVIVALAVLGEAVGVGGAQAIVGAGMGAGVGAMQARALRGVLPRRRAWCVRTVLGLAAPFVVADLARVARWELPYSLPVCVVAGGLVAAGLQTSLLRGRLGRANGWLPASALGWLAAAGSTAASDALSVAGPLPGLAGALAYLAVVASGGPLLGLATGVALRAMVGREKGDG